MVNQECKQCGTCCRFEIPVTILDLERIIEYLQVDYKTAFQDFLQKEKSGKTGIFKLSKKQEGECIFLNKEKKCSIHEVKPNICRFYNCQAASKDNEMPWTLFYSTPDDRVVIWEQSVATEITKRYIEHQGLKYNREAYQKALNSIYNNIIQKETQKIKLARNDKNAPICMIYDCSKCSNHGTKAYETPVTLTDIKRIVEHTNISYQTFFNRYLDSETGSNGAFKLKRDISCVFFDPKDHCTVSEAKPLHCKFTPCPRKTSNSTEFDCYYLGSGTIGEQFEHQAALQFTKDYAGKYGVNYNKKAFNKFCKEIQRFLHTEKNKEVFRNAISPYRYIDDTELLKK
jgi:Fe-S-cluster containining protein